MFKILIKILLPAVLLSLPLPAVSLDEAVASAEKNNINLEMARISLNQILRNQNNVMSTFMPSLTANAGISTGAAFPPALKETTYNGLGISAGINAGFNFSGSMLNDSESRRLKKESAWLSYESTADSITEAVVSSYWQIAVLNAQKDAAAASLEDASTAYSSAEESWENGMLSDLDLAQAELAVTSAELKVQTVDDSIMKAMAAFRNMTGLEGDFSIDPLPDFTYLDLPSAEELFSEYSEMTNTVRSARNSLSTARNSEKSLKYSTYVPSVSVGVNYSYAGSYDDSWKYSDRTHSLTGSVTVSVPVSAMIPGGSGYMAVKDAGDAVTLASLSLQNEQRTLLENIRSAVMDIEQSENNRKSTEKALQNAERSYNLTMEAFDAGLVSADKLDSARNSYLIAQTNLMALDADHITACYKLADILNISFSELKTKYSTETI